MMVKLLSVPLLLACATLLAACAGADPQAKQIGRSDLAGWPLTVESGLLKCEGSGGVGRVTIEVDGTSYAVNGLAKGGGSNADIAPIWADDSTPALKKDIGPLIEEGLRLCK